MSPCHVCRAPRVAVLLDFDRQPICNRFLATPADEEYTHHLVMGQCQACGLVQLTNTPVPAEELKPRYEWVTYREPEEHLDRLADTISRLPGITKDSVLAGISFKDDSLLERMKARGFRHVWRIDLEKDLSVHDPGAGVETIQNRLDSARAAELGRRHGRPDVLVARHILEHAQDVRRFTSTLKTLLSPTGYLVLEVPDCTRALNTCDYTMLWEEHTLYFTPETFQGYCVFSGLSLLQFDVFPYVMENSLVGIGRFQEGLAPQFPTEHALREETARVKGFAERFGTQRQKLQQWLADFRTTQGKIALLGAGHLGCTFINLLELTDYVEFIVDDHPNKQGLFMPGSRLPIRGSSALLTDDVRLCLLGLSPESEDTVIQRNAQFLNRGGTFASILRGSKRALTI